MAKKDGIVGLFESADGVVSITKIQALLFTVCLVIMLMVDTFTEKNVSWDSYLVAAAGAVVGIVDTFKDNQLAIFKIKENETLTFTAGNIIAKDKDGNEVYSSYYGRPVVDNKIEAEQAKRYKEAGRDYYSSSEYQKIKNDCRGGGKSKHSQFVLGEDKNPSNQICIDEFAEVPKEAVEKLLGKTKLPWKDVSELPKNKSNLFVLRKDGDIVPSRYDEQAILHFSGNCLEDITSWCSLTDLINSIETMLSRQDELEERIRKLEGR